MGDQRIARRSLDSVAIARIVVVRWTRARTRTRTRTRARFRTRND